MGAPELLKLSAYAGERERAPAGGLVADALIDLYAARGVSTSVLLRGVEGFGLSHHLRTEELLTLSDDLPVVAVALDRPAVIEALAADAAALSPKGLVAIERIASAEPGGAGAGEGSSAGVGNGSTGGSGAVGPQGAKLSAYFGRGARAQGRAAQQAVVELMSRHRLDGAVALVGLDGTLGGTRARARLLGPNSGVPQVVQGVGQADAVAAAAAELQRLLPGAAVTVERVQVCWREGFLAAAVAIPERDAQGLGYWQRLELYVRESTRRGRSPLHGVLLRRLRREGAAGATVLRGEWGFQGAGAPHGERMLSLARHVPILISVIDTPGNARRWLSLAEELLGDSGIATLETVPALHSTAPAGEIGGLRLAAPLP